MGGGIGGGCEGGGRGSGEVGGGGGRGGGRGDGGGCGGDGFGGGLGFSAARSWAAGSLGPFFPAPSERTSNTRTAVTIKSVKHVAGTHQASSDLRGKTLSGRARYIPRSLSMRRTRAPVPSVSQFKKNGDVGFRFDGILSPIYGCVLETNDTLL